MFVSDGDGKKLFKCENEDIKRVIWQSKEEIFMTEVRDYTWPVTEMVYKEMQNLKEVVDRNIEKIKGKKLLIFGSGIRGNEFMQLLRKWNIDIYGFVDNNKDKWGGKIADYTIYSPDILTQSSDYAVLVSVEISDAINRQLEEMGYKFNENYFVVKTDIYEEYIKEVARPLSDYTLIQGCCFFTTISMSDEEGQTDNLTDLLYERLGKDKCKILGIHGLMMPIYYEMLRLQLMMGYKPKKAVVCFSLPNLLNRHSYYPRAQHPVLFERIQKELQIEDEQYSQFVKLRRERFENLQTDAFVSKTSKAKSYEKVAKMNFKLRYMAEIEDDSESVFYLKKIIQLCRENDISVWIGIDPVNYIFGERCFGKDFLEYYDKNLQYVKNFSQKEKVNLFDLSFILEKEDLSGEDAVTEISRYSGRVKVADYMSQVLA